jgi:hypothetical protein
MPRDAQVRGVSRERVSCGGGSCDCSLCRRRAALIRRVEENRLRLLTPLADLALYRWYTRTTEDYFCPVCGILPFRRPRHRTREEIGQGLRVEEWL